MGESIDKTICVRCNKLWGTHVSECDLTQKKPYCAWCLVRLEHTDEDYITLGNMCKVCSGKCDNVVHDIISPEEAIRGLLLKRITNKILWKRS